jgi:hypothetical protein
MMSYSGWKINEQDRAALLAAFPPRYPDVMAHHVTLRRGDKSVPDFARFAVVGHVDDGLGCEALIVARDGMTENGSRTFHVTWSIDREAGRKPVHSNDVIAGGWEAVEARSFEATPFRVDHDRVEHFHTDESAARSRCRAEGMDPDFVGEKGYENWRMFTDAARAQTRAFLRATEEMIRDR